VADTADLVLAVEACPSTPTQLGNGAKELLDEVATGKVTGEEEIWSHTDLWDFQANVDGARIAFENLEPALRDEGPRARRPRSTERFAALQTLLDQYRDGDGFVLYTELTADAGEGARRRGQRAQRAARRADGGGGAVSLSAADASWRRRCGAWPARPR
jgi:iron uptake system component EfeO